MGAHAVAEGQSTTGAGEGGERRGAARAQHGISMPYVMWQRRVVAVGHSRCCRGTCNDACLLRARETGAQRLGGQR